MLIFYFHVKNSHGIGSLFLVYHSHKRVVRGGRQCILLGQNLLDTGLTRFCYRRILYFKQFFSFLLLLMNLILIVVT